MRMCRTEATRSLPGTRAPNRNPNKPIINPAANPVPDKNQRMELQEQHEKAVSYTAANTERQKQISDDATRLLQLATELKKEVDKTDKDTLSVNVIRKAEMINPRLCPCTTAISVRCPCCWKPRLSLI